MGKAATKFVAVRFSEKVEFETRADARRFALNEGDCNRLWNLIEVPASFAGSCDDLYTMLEAA